MPREIPVGSCDELAPGKRKLTFVDGRLVILFNIDGAIHAVDDSCPHNGASLASGQLEGNLLRCPAHGLRFNVATGCTPGENPLCLKTFPVREADGKLFLVPE
jgi:3-phenylpropionate/trans-cinnamate dioxygenase ferredoxin subunit